MGSNVVFGSASAKSWSVTASAIFGSLRRAMAPWPHSLKRPTASGFAYRTGSQRSRRHHSAIAARGQKRWSCLLRRVRLFTRPAQYASCQASADQRACAFVELALRGHHGWAHVAGNRVRCRQVRACRRAVSRALQSRPSGAPFQAGEHVEQRRCYRRWRRDRPGAGVASAASKTSANSTNAQAR